MAKYKKRKDGRYSTTVTNGYKPDGSPACSGYDRHPQARFC